MLKKSKSFPLFMILAIRILVLLFVYLNNSYVF